MNRFTTSVSRRTFLKVTAAGAGALAAPALISRAALASSGGLNFMGWAGYPDLAAKVFPAFEKATGIKVIFNEQPDQDAMFAQAKLSLQTGAIDVAEPTVDRIGGWASNGLAQGWDGNRLNIDNYLPGRRQDGDGDRRRQAHDRARQGTSQRSSPDRCADRIRQGEPGDLFDPKFEGKVCTRPHSALAAMGRYLDTKASCRSHGSAATRTKRP